MNVLVLSQYFWPEPITRPVEIAEALRDQGHSVQIVTGFPNYPDGNLYSGYPLRLYRRDLVKGIPVIRTILYPSHDASRLGRVLNYGSFMLSSIGGALLADRFDVIYVWHPPLSIGIAAAAISALRKRPFVYDVLDIWPESAVAVGFLGRGKLFDVLARVERFVYSRAAHIFVVTDAGKANLIEKGVPETKISVSPPWYDDDELRQVETGARASIRSRENWHDRFVVMFAGNMGVLQGLDTIVHACKHLPPGSNVLVALVGDGSDLPRLKQLTRESGVGDRVQFVPRQTASDMARYYAAADALFVHLRTSPVAAFTIPQKTVAYLAAGKPILLASTGASTEVVSSARAGIVVPPDDPAVLATALVEMSRLDEDERVRMGARGRNYFQAHFTRETIIPRYIDALKRVASQSASREAR